MISVKINNQFVDLFEDASLKYVFNSPAFSDAAVVGDFSYPMSFPLTDLNKEIFNYIDLVDTYEDVINYPFELYLKDQFIVGGNFKVTDIEGKISGNLLNSGYGFINTIKNKTTRDLQMSDITRHTGDIQEIIEASHASGYPTYHFAHFPILNEILYDDIEYEDINWKTLPYLNFYTYDINNDPVFFIHVLFPYLAHVVDSIFSTFDIRAENNLIAEHTELKKLVLLNLYRKRKYPETYRLVDNIVEVSIEELLKGINDTLGIKLFFDHRVNQVEMIYLKDLLSSGDYVDWTDKVVNQPKKNISEDLSFKSFEFDFDSGDETISAIQIIKEIFDELTLTAPVNSTVQLPDYSSGGWSSHAGETTFVVSDQCYYIIVDDGTGVYGWEPLTWKFFKKLLNEENEKEHNSTLSPVGMLDHLLRHDLGVERGSTSGTSTSQAYYNTYWLTPFWNQKLFQKSTSGALARLKPDDLNGNVSGPDYIDIKARLLFFRGLRDDHSNYKYPLGTNSHYDCKGTSIGSLSLTWEGSDGLYENFWKDWIEFINKAKPYPFEIQLDMVDILSLKMKKKVRIANNKYLIKKISVDFPIKKPAIVELVRI